MPEVFQVSKVLDLAPADNLIVVQKHKLEVFKLLQVLGFREELDEVK